MGGDALIVIGLTGKYCAGKNYIATLFAEKDIPVIEVDDLGHEAVEKSKDELIALFGRRIITPQGTVNRRVLGSIVFSKSQALKSLEQAVHPRMVSMCIQIIERYRGQSERAVVINAALLHRMNLDVLCDTVCFVKTPWFLRLARAVKRDNATFSSFMRMNKSQEDIEPSAIRGAKSLHLLKNWGRTAFIHRQVDEFCATMSL